MNHAAFARADIADARRGRPDVDLRPYAEDRGFEYRGQELAGHFSGLNPPWVDYVFNSMRGELAAGRFGTLQHELYQVELADDGRPRMPGTFHGRRTVTRPGLRTFIGLSKKEKNEPFAAQAMWLPVTGVKLLVPEAALVPKTIIMSKAHLTLSDPKLGDAAPGFRVVRQPWLSSELRATLADQLGPILDMLDATFARLELAYGALGLQVNGFVTEPERLDTLLVAAGALAESATELDRPMWRPAPFDHPLGPFNASQHPPGYHSFDIKLDRSGMDALARHGTELGLTVEDPVALHRALPRLPIPGISRGVLAGALPGSSGLGRLTWQFQGHPGSSIYLRGGGVFAARADAPPTTPGGVLLHDTDMYVAVQDGVACCWSRILTKGALDAAALATRCVASMRASGLADV